jgi:hypothetical protein
MTRKGIFIPCFPWLVSVPSVIRPGLRLEVIERQEQNYLFLGQQVRPLLFLRLSNLLTVSMGAAFFIASICALPKIREVARSAARSPPR